MSSPRVLKSLAAPILSALQIFVIDFAVSGCGGGGSSSPPPPLAVAPSISAQPQGQTVTAPATATFSVTATGTPRLSYQWSKNGAAISAATSATYITPATTSADNGAMFAVVVRNSGGSVTSNSAILTVHVISPGTAIEHLADVNVNNAAVSLTLPPQSITLLVVPTTSPLNLSPASLTLASTVVGRRSPSSSVTLTNPNNFVITVNSIAASGDFSQTNNCGNALAANGNCTASVSFAPTAAGARNGLLTVNSTAANNPQNVTLAGTGVDFTIGLSRPGRPPRAPPGHFLVKDAGIYTQIERRGYPSEYWSGQVIQNWNQFDSVVGSTVSQEVSLQLDKLKALGVNTITFELRAADPTFTGTFVPPDCNLGPALGLQFPQPTTTELANLPLFFDMVQSKGIKVWLRLVNTHMEQQPPTNSQTWLGAIFGAIGKHPALDLILFEGDAHLEPGPNGTITCGIPAEPLLQLGPGSVPVTYVQWAVNFALSQGLPSQKVSAEAQVGSYFVESNPPAGSNATNGHLWSPIAVEKTIFDNLNIPANQRTYALSFYEHRKCSDAQSLPCTDLDPHDWADQTLQYVTGVVGSGPRIVAPEMGDLPPVDQVNWNTQHALESLVFLLQKYAIDGGSFWRWASFMNTEDSDPTLATPVKVRGTSFVFNPVWKEVLDMGGFHVPMVPNGSFEGPTAMNGVPVNWTAAGTGTVSRYLLTQEPGEPEVPSRGIYAMRMITGTGANDSVMASSVNIPVGPTTTYTTTANMRFAWTGDPNPTGLPALRPQVFIAVLYFQQNGTPSSIHTQDTVAYFQENSTTGFATFPVQYTTPSDAAFMAIQFGAARNGLPGQITLDVDNVR